MANPNLTIPHNEVITKLNIQITQGKNLQQIRINDRPALQNVRAEYDKWYKYNATLLKKVFDDDKISHGYTEVGIIIPQHNIHEEIQGLKDDIKYDVEYLENLVNRLDLYDYIEPEKAKVVSVGDSDKTIYDNWIKWFKNNKLIAAIIIGVAVILTVFAIIKGAKEIMDIFTSSDTAQQHISNDTNKEVQEVKDYKPHIRVYSGDADLADTQEDLKKAFQINIENKGYKIDLRYTRLIPFLEVYKYDGTTSIIPLNEKQYVSESTDKVGLLVSYQTENLFDLIENINEQLVDKLTLFLSKSKEVVLIGVKLKYILQISYSNDMLDKPDKMFFEIINYNSKSISKENGENYFKLTEGGIPNKIGDLSVDFLSGIIMD